MSMEWYRHSCGYSVLRANDAQQQARLFPTCHENELACSGDYYPFASIRAEASHATNNCDITFQPTRFTHQLPHCDGGRYAYIVVSGRTHNTSHERTKQTDT